MIEDATKTSNQTSLRPARLEDLSRLDEGWELDHYGHRLLFTVYSGGGFTFWTDGRLRVSLSPEMLDHACEHGLLYCPCPVEEPKPLECEGTLIKIGSNVTMFMGEAWAGKYVHVGEMREGGKWQWVPDGSTVLRPEREGA